MAARKMFDKLHDCRGETLVEILAAILVAALAAALLFTCVTTSDRINRKARILDNGYYSSYNAAELQSEIASSGVEIEVAEMTENAGVASTAALANVKVNLYGKGSGSGKKVYSYKE